MKVGTKSLLFGVHQVFWHPITVWLAWNKLYGRPNFRETVCIIIHDWGYWGLPNMDGEEGKRHPNKAGDIVLALGWGESYRQLCICHSRTTAKMCGQMPSRLCWADKISMCYDPVGFYLARARLTGELAEYRKESDKNGICSIEVSDREWFEKIVGFLKNQADTYKYDY